MQAKTAAKPRCTKPSSGISFGGLQLKFKLLNFSQMSRNKKDCRFMSEKRSNTGLIPKGIVYSPKTVLLLSYWDKGSI